MTDPFDALTSFQQALLDGEISLQAGELDPDLFVHFDKPTGVPRITYVRLDGQTVTALALMVRTEPMHGLPCFQAGVAVPEAYGGKGTRQERCCSRDSRVEAWAFAKQDLVFPRRGNR